MCLNGFNVVGKSLSSDRSGKVRSKNPSGTIKTDREGKICLLHELNSHLVSQSSAGGNVWSRNI